MLEAIGMENIQIRLLPARMITDCCICFSAGSFWNDRQIIFVVFEKKSLKSMRTRLRHIRWQKSESCRTLKNEVGPHRNLFSHLKEGDHNETV